MRVRVEPHDPSWSDGFRAEASRIRAALGMAVVAIHHVGSTAIPGIYAKPILDLLVEVTDLVSVDERSSAMEELGYETMGEFGIEGRRYFRRDDAQGVRTHHVHVFESESGEVERHLAFRDYLIAHPDRARAYSDLKRALVARHPESMNAYIAGKDSFVRETEQMALVWKRRQV